MRPSSWASLTGRFQQAFSRPALDFQAVEGLAGAILLDDLDAGALDPFVGRVAVFAGQTLASPPGGESVLAGPRVDHAIVIGLAKGAAHKNLELSA